MKNMVYMIDYLDSNNSQLDNDNLQIEEKKKKQKEWFEIQIYIEDK